MLPLDGSRDNYLANQARLDSIRRRQAEREAAKAAK